MSFGDVLSYNEVYTLADCFEDLDEPKYGFRVWVTLKENEPCNLNTTCLVTLDTSAQERQTNEEFSSDAPPDCRISTG